MKRLLFILLTLLSVASQAQTTIDTQYYNRSKSNNIWDGGIFDSILGAPRVKAAHGKNEGSIVYNRNLRTLEVYDSITKQWYPLTSFQLRDGVVQGGNVSWTGTGLQFYVSESVYVISGVLYFGNDTTVTLAAADGTNPRQDVIALNNIGVYVLTGTPAADPAKPQVTPGSELELTSILVAAGATTPTGISQEVIYDENTEWTVTSSNITINANNTLFPYRGSKSLDVDAYTAAAGRTVTFTKGSLVDMTQYSLLTLYMRLNADYANNATISLQFRTSSTSNFASPNTITISNNNYNYVRTNDAVYQTIQVPLSAFTFSALNFSTSPTNLNRLVVTFNGAADGMYIDYINLQGGINIPSGGVVSFNGRSGNVTPIKADYAQWFGDTSYRRSDSVFWLKSGIEYFQYKDSIGAGGGGGIPTDSSVSINNRINLKLNISDTATMLAPYLRKIDTTGKWIGIGWLPLIVKYSDTTSMLANYVRQQRLIDSMAAVQNRLDTTRNGIRTDLNGKQPTLVSATNIKTVNGNTLLGSGDLVISGGGGSTVTNFGLDSTGENFYGTIYDSTTWTTLGNFTNNGGSFTVTSNKIVGSGGAGTFTQSLDLNYYTMLERWKISAKVKASASANGFGLGIRSAETGTKVNLVGRFDATSGNVVINAGQSNTQVAVTVSPISFSTNDYIILTVERDKDIVTVSARNATTNSATISTSYTFLTADATVQLPNTGKFAVYSFGSSFTVDSLAITSKESKHAMVMAIGDSKTQAYYASTWANRWAEKLGVKFKSTVISAGGYDQTQDVINRLPEIIALAPKQIILAISSNDVRNAVSLATINANIDTIVVRIERDLPGSEVYLTNGFYETGIDQTGVKAHIEATYPTKYFDTYNPTQQPSTLSGDNVHLNDLGNTLAYDAIIQKMKLVGGNNVGSSGSSTNLATSSIPFSNGSSLVEDNTNFRWDNSSKLLGVGGTPTARGHFFTSADGAPATLTAFTDKHFVVGPSGSGLAISYSTSAGRSYLSSVSPGAAWRSIGIQSNDINFYYQGGSTPAWSVDGNGAHSNTGSLNNPLRNTFINTNTGANAYSEIAIGQSATATDQLRIVTTSTGFTTSSNYVQDGASIEAGSTLSGGLSIASTNGSGVIRFYTGGTTERARFTSLGHLTLVNRMQTAKGANVASANDLTLGNDGNVFHITGTTQINAITTTNWQAGSEIILIFDASVTVKNNTSGGGSTAVMLLQGAADFSATANDVLKLIFDGTSWYEVSRSVN